MSYLRRPYPHKFYEINVQYCKISRRILFVASIFILIDLLRIHFPTRKLVPPSNSLANIFLLAWANGKHINLQSCALVIVPSVLRLSFWLNQRRFWSFTDRGRLYLGHISPSSFSSPSVSPSSFLFLLAMSRRPSCLSFWKHFSNNL